MLGRRALASSSRLLVQQRPSRVPAARAISGGKPQKGACGN